MESPWSKLDIKWFVGQEKLYYNSFHFLESLPFSFECLEYTGTMMSVSYGRPRTRKQSNFLSYVLNTGVITIVRNKSYLYIAHNLLEKIFRIIWTIILEKGVAGEEQAT